MSMKDLKQKSKTAAEKTGKWIKELPDETHHIAEEAQRNPKQAAVAGIILLVAILLLVLAFAGRKESPKQAIEKTQAPAATVTAPIPATVETPKEEMAAPKEETKAEPEKEIIKVEPKNAVLTFDATAEKDFTYQVFYTVAREVWFDGEHNVEYPGKAGTHKYSIVLPAQEVFRIRLDFASNPGTVTIKDIRLTGSQQADLNNWSEYELNQMDKATPNEDGSFTIISEQDDPYMAYRPALLPE